MPPLIHNHPSIVPVLCQIPAFTWPVLVLLSGFYLRCGCVSKPYTSEISLQLGSMLSLQLSVQLYFGQFWLSQKMVPGLIWVYGKSQNTAGTRICYPQGVFVPILMNRRAVCLPWDLSPCRVSALHHLYSIHVRHGNYFSPCHTGYSQGMLPTLITLPLFFIGIPSGADLQNFRLCTLVLKKKMVVLKLSPFPL